MLEIGMNYLYNGSLKKNTKRIVICCAALLFPALLVAAKGSATESEQGTFSGDYVIYRDYSWKAPTWIGFLYYNDETYGAFIRSDSQGKETTISILFSTRIEKGSLVLTGQKIISPVTPDDTVKVNYLMTLLPTLYSCKTFPRATRLPFGRTHTHKKIEAFGGKTDLDFHSFIPLFHLNTLTDAKKMLLLELIETGSVKGGKDADFYGYTPIELKTEKNTFQRNRSAKKETVYVSDIPLYLDSQWKKIADNSFLCGNAAFLTVSTATIPSIKEVSLLEAQEHLIKVLTASSPYAKVLCAHTTINGTHEAFTVNQFIYDVESRRISKDIKRCIKQQDSSFTVISLTVDSAAYSAEKAYFNALF